jgi:hypothetical protein
MCTGINLCARRDAIVIINDIIHGSGSHAFVGQSETSGKLLKNRHIDYRTSDARTRFFLKHTNRNACGQK